MSTPEESTNSRDVESHQTDGATTPVDEQTRMSSDVAPTPAAVLLDEKTSAVNEYPDNTRSAEELESAELIPLDEPDSQENSDNASLFDDATHDQAMVPDLAFEPPSIPGMRAEVTKPLKLSGQDMPSDEETPVEIPPNAANPEMGGGPRSETTKSLLDDLVGPPLDDQTLDLELPALLRDYSVHDIPTDDSETMEGLPYDEEDEDLETPPLPGEEILLGDNKAVTLGESLGEQDGFVFYRARLAGESGSFTAVWSPRPCYEPPWEHIPDARIIRPVAKTVNETFSLRVFSRPKGNTVVDYLSQKDRNLPAVATLELGIQLAQILEGVHATGLQILNLDPSQIVIEKGGKVRLYAISGLLPVGRFPREPVGLFASPEVRRGLSYLIGGHSDVYSVALLVYALLARRAPLDSNLDPALLVSPRVFRTDFPTGIWPHLKPCLAAIPSARVGHARGLRMCLEAARIEVLREARAVQDNAETYLESWAELHTGLGKARRGAPQQDRAFTGTSESAQVGLFVIADGVSRSKFGDGAYAAQQVENASRRKWEALRRSGAAGLHLEHPERVDVLRDIALDAGKEICRQVNEEHAPVPNEPNQVMSATLAAAYIVDGEVTIGNLGDSRVYLIRNGYIERISVDHDRATDALRVGLSFPDAANVRMAAALTRIVGRVVIDEEHRAHPDPFEPEIFRVRLLPEDRLVLCSDGIPDFAAGPGADQEEAEQRMLEVLNEFADPARAAFELIVLANRGGGYDNLSCIVIAAHPG